MDQNTAPAGSTEPAQGDCVVFDASAEFAHFRQPHAAPSAETYGIMPRPTVAGMIAAMLGMPRDSYYDIFGPERSRIAVSVEAPVRRQTVGINYLSTLGSDAKTKGANVTENITGHRDPTAVGLLSEPSYRIYVALDDHGLMGEIDAVARGADPDADGGTAPVYTPTLGSASHLAWIDYVGRFPIETPTDDAGGSESSSGTVEIRSAIPGDEIPLVVDPDHHYASETMTAYMESDGDGDGRRPVGTHTVTYTRSGEPMEIRKRDATYATVGGDHVVFS